MPIRLLPLIGLILGLSVRPAVAQDSGTVDPRPREHGPLVLELPGSTRALALGGVFVTDPTDSDAIFYDASRISQRGFSAAYQRYGSGASHLTASAGTRWLGGTVGIGVSTLEYGAAGSFPGDLLRDPGSLTVPGEYAASEFVATVGYGRSVGGLRVGAAGKVVGQRLSASRGSTAALDVGVSTEVRGVTLSVAAQNLGADLQVAGQEVSLPRRLSLGFDTERAVVGPLDVGVAGRVTRDGDGEILPGGGIEVAWWPVVGRTFIGRVGVQRVVDGSASPVTFGGGFSGDSFRIDYAFQAFDGLDGAHRVGISFR